MVATDNKKKSSVSHARLRVSFVIGGLCAFVVLIVAVVTLAITYSVSLTTVRDIGRQHSAALADNARRQTQSYFQLPSDQLAAIQLTVRTGDFRLPADEVDPSDSTVRLKWYAATSVNCYGAQLRYSLCGVYLEDGSGTDLSECGHDPSLACSASYIRDKAGNTFRTIRAFNRSNGVEGNSAAVASMYPAVAEHRVVPAYIFAASKGRESLQGFFFGAQLLVRPIWTRFVFPLAIGLYNSSNHFLGVSTLQQPLTAIPDFLRSVKSTPNTEAFAIQADGRLLGTTTSRPFYYLVRRNQSDAPAPGCVSSDTARLAADEQTVHACREAAATFDYAPLRAVAQDTNFIATPTHAVRDVVVNGDRYFVASAGVANTFLFWQMNILLCVPENDIIGKIVAGRDLAIGITAAVFLVAAVFAFVLVHAILRPLSDVSNRMLRTARLRDENDLEADQAGFSSLREIHDLQEAYSNMNTAIKSFARYVPRDVVKDLMATGQLCTIQMMPQWCSMLFVEIAGFSTICDRVPPDDLSRLVSQYFDRASHIIMRHDGLIDKFIGDCIMAVWGAPFAVANQEVKAVLAGLLIHHETMAPPLRDAWDDVAEELHVRVGISTGEVLAGNMGSADRMNYTVIGDPVNLASRLEAMNKQFGTHVIISEETADALGGLFVLRFLMPIVVVGKEHPVKVYEPVGLVRDFDPADVMRLQEADRRCGVRSTSDSDSIASLNDAASVAHHDGGVQTVSIHPPSQQQPHESGSLTRFAPSSAKYNNQHNRSNNNTNGNGSAVMPPAVALGRGGAAGTAGKVDVILRPDGRATVAHCNNTHDGTTATTATAGLPTSSLATADFGYGKYSARPRPSRATTMTMLTDAIARNKQQHASPASPSSEQSQQPAADPMPQELAEFSETLGQTDGGGASKCVTPVDRRGLHRDDVACSRSSRAPPLVCTPAMEQQAQLHSHAVQLYMKTQFAEAIAVLDQLTAIQQTAARMDSAGDEGRSPAHSGTFCSMQLVRDRCEELLRARGHRSGSGGVSPEPADAAPAARMCVPSITTSSTTAVVGPAANDAAFPAQV